MFGCGGEGERFRRTDDLLLLLVRHVLFGRSEKVLFLFAMLFVILLVDLCLVVVVREREKAH